MNTGKVTGKQQRPASKDKGEALGLNTQGEGDKARLVTLRVEQQGRGGGNNKKE